MHDGNKVHKMFLVFLHESIYTKNSTSNACLLLDSVQEYIGGISGMRWKRMAAIVLCILAVTIPVLVGNGRDRNQASAAATLDPAAQPYNTVVRWEQETQKNKMGDDICMTTGYNAEGNTVVSILEEDVPIITVSTYDALGRKTEVASYDNDKRFVHSTYTYNEQGEKASWKYQARTPEGVTDTTQTYEYQYDADVITEKTTYQSGQPVSKETYTREQTEQGTVVRTVVPGELSPDLTCYDDAGKPLWREKDTYRMVYYYDRLGRETENCVIDNGMQQNRTITVYGEDGLVCRRILYGVSMDDVISVSEIEQLTETPEIWLDFAQKQETTVILTPEIAQPQKIEEAPEIEQTQEVERLAES